MRARNLSSAEFCRYCEDGWVVADPGTSEEKRQEYLATAKEVMKGVPRKHHRMVLANMPIHGEAMAPCPFCERGYANEFPERDGAGRAYFPFGEDGYWKGRDTSGLKPYEPKVFLSKEENAKRVRELMATIGLVPKEMAA